MRHVGRRRGGGGAGRVEGWSAVITVSLLRSVGGRCSDGSWLGCFGRGGWCFLRVSGVGIVRRCGGGGLLAGFGARFSACAGSLVSAGLRGGCHFICWCVVVACELGACGWGLVHRGAVA